MDELTQDTRCKDFMAFQGLDLWFDRKTRDQTRTARRDPKTHRYQINSTDTVSNNDHNITCYSTAPQVTIFIPLAWNVSQLDDTPVLWIQQTIKSAPANLNTKSVWIWQVDQH